MWIDFRFVRLRQTRPSAALPRTNPAPKILRGACVPPTACMRELVPVLRSGRRVDATISSLASSNCVFILISLRSVVSVVIVKNLRPSFNGVRKIRVIYEISKCDLEHRSAPFSPSPKNVLAPGCGRKPRPIQGPLGGSGVALVRDRLISSTASSTKAVYKLRACEEYCLEASRVAAKVNR